jgi:SAM-dependent methyltransferase
MGLARWNMAAYAEFARFYDQVNGEPETRSRQLLANIERHHPGATSVLEMGCGTGAILAGLGSGPSLTGIDRSPEMLDYARRRCPGARLLEADMTSFSLPERFDVVLCVFDTINHVADFEGWRQTFHQVHEHLNAGGLFIFDVNTLGRLRQLGDVAPWVHHFDGHTLIMDVEFDGDALSTWDIRIFERRDDRHFTLHHEEIIELGVALDRVRQALDEEFELVEESDASGDPPTDESPRAFFVYRRR